MDKRQASHDILNMLERIRVMHDLARDQNFEEIGLAELKSDLKETLEKIEEDFKVLFQ